MHQLISHLKDSIDDAFYLSCSGKELTIVEKDSGASCKKIIFRTASTKFFALSLDVKLSKGCQVFPFFKSSQPGLSKVNDAIVFYTKGSEVFLVLVELKSSKPGRYLKQLKAGLSFARFLLDIIGETHKKTYSLKDENIRCVLFDTRKHPPKGTSQRKGKGVSFEDRSGLWVTHQPCNDVVQLEKLLEALPI